MQLGSRTAVVCVPVREQNKANGCAVKRHDYPVSISGIARINHDTARVTGEEIAVHNATGDSFDTGHCVHSLSKKSTAPLISFSSGCPLFKPPISFKGP